MTFIMQNSFWAKVIHNSIADDVQHNIRVSNISRGNRLCFRDFGFCPVYANYWVLIQLSGLVWLVWLSCFLQSCWVQCSLVGILYGSQFCLTGSCVIVRLFGHGS